MDTVGLKATDNLTITLYFGLTLKDFGGDRPRRSPGTVSWKVTLCDLILTRQTDKSAWRQ